MERSQLPNRKRVQKRDCLSKTDHYLSGVNGFFHLLPGGFGGDLFAGVGNPGLGTELVFQLFEHCGRILQFGIAVGQE